MAGYIRRPITTGSAEQILRVSGNLFGDLPEPIRRLTRTHSETYPNQFGDLPEPIRELTRTHSETCPNPFGNLSELIRELCRAGALEKPQKNVLRSKRILFKRRGIDKNSKNVSTSAVAKSPILWAKMLHLWQSPMYCNTCVCLLKNLIL